jgi:nitrogen regulatory protein P-II 1
MKLITAFIQPYKLHDVKDELYKAEVFKMSVSNVLGAGQQKGYTETYRGVAFEVNLLKKIKIEIVVNDKYVQATVDAIIKGARTGEIGDGKILISPVEEVIRIRSGEKGEVAVG